MGYNLLIGVAAIVLAPFAALICLVRPGWRQGLAARLGMGWPNASGAGPVLWAHAASVGEMEGIAPLVRRWQQENPRGRTVVSALTATGCATARRLLPDGCVLTFPIDLPWIARRVVGRVRPSLFLFSENEIWPNVIFELDRAGVPIVQVSGRLSPGAAAAFSRFPGFARSVLGRVTRFCVQNEEHRGRLCALGVDPERVVVTGSLKGEGELPDAPPFLAGIAAGGRPILIAGSTHPGEERAVLGAIADLRSAAGSSAGAAEDRQTTPLWVIAPRHPERFAEVAALLTRAGVPFARRSALDGEDGAQRELAAAEVLLLDSIGELAGCYRVALAAFVGGSLVPVGGHNLLEAARCGVPLVVGPHLESVAALAGRLEREGAARLIGSPEELGPALAAYLDPEVRARASLAARRTALAESGGLAATWAAVGAAIAPRRAA
ncbi:MAG TPA: glycosyltransferase N-terminal domain-containing protein [Candidatus Bathyarchaeia archaeon]|nr:glycosyltransferase N-terminal domain-containing protein [Candidatus Bathyarchaeia archaeon]